MVLTSGKLNRREVASIRRAGELFNRSGWKLFVTGSAHSERALLIAANQGLLDWVLIEQANFAAYIRQARASLQPEPKDRPKTAPPKVAAAMPSTLGESPLRTIPRPSYFTPQWPERDSAAGGPRQPRDITTRSRTEFEVTFSGGPSPAPPAKPTELPSKKDAPVALSAPEEPNRASEVVEATKTDQEETGSKPTQPIWGRAKRWIGHVWPWLLIGIGALPIMAVGTMVARGSHRAQEIRTKLRGYVKTRKSSNDGMLVATINGQARHLGRLSRLRPIHIGSGVKNTIRIVEKGVRDRHLCLYQKAGKLMVQNLSRNPVSIGGLALEPKAKRAVVLPSVIELTENVKLRISVLWTNDGTANQRSEGHGQNKQ